MAYSNRPQRQGFTLIELLVAITILATVAVLGWRGLDGIIRARSSIDHDMERTRSVQLVFAQIQSDFQHLASDSDLPGRLSFVADNGNMTLLRTSLSENQVQQFSVVSYRFHEGNFTRRESLSTRDMNQLDSMWQAALADTDPGPSIQLQSDIETVTMRSYREGAWTSTILPPNPGEKMPATPSAVEVEIYIKDHRYSLLKLFLVGAG